MTLLSSVTHLKETVHCVGLLGPLVLRPTAGPPPALCRSYVSVDVEPHVPPFVQGRHSLYRHAGQHPDSPLNPSVISKESGNFHH